jgi:hypothetical protein
MSARSRLRPTEKKRHPSSRLIVASTMPLQAAARSRTQPKNSWRAGPDPKRARGPTSRYIVLRVSHNSEDSASRAARVLPRRRHGTRDRSREREVLGKQRVDGGRVGLVTHCRRVGTHGVETLERPLTHLGVLQPVGLDVVRIGTSPR